MKKAFLLALIAGNALAGYAQNVGIGTITPTDQLHTTGTVRFQNYSSPGNKLLYIDSTGRLTTAPAGTIQDNGATGLAIPDAGCASGNGATSGITISGLPAAVPSARIAVRVTVFHSYDQDLQLFLTAPNGTVICLSASNGSSGHNYTGTVFTDSAATIITGGLAPFSGRYKPQGIFSGCGVTATAATFGAIGGGTINPNGNWTLRIFDNAGIDSGRLESWQISFDGPGSYGSGPVAYYNNGTLSPGNITNAPGGNIGISNTNPKATLDINGSLALRNADAGAGRVLTSDSFGNATWSAAGNVQSNTYVLSEDPADANLTTNNYTNVASALFDSRTTQSSTSNTQSWVSSSEFLTERAEPVVLNGTGNKFVVFGGYDAVGYLSNGGIYNPGTDTWVPIPDMGDGIRRSLPSVAWTGTKLIVWSGNDGTVATNTGMIYEESTRTWTNMNTVSAPVGRGLGACGYNAATNEFVVWGGTSASGLPLGDGARYNLSTNTWTAIATTGAPTIRSSFASGVNGGKLFLFGGRIQSTGLLTNTAYYYDIATNTWSTIAAASPLTARWNIRAAYTGSAYVLYGGNDLNSTSFTDGATFNTGTNSWTMMSGTGPTGSAIVNAFGNNTYITGSSRYSFANNTWSTLPGNRNRYGYGLGANAVCIFQCEGKVSGTGGGGTLFDPFLRDGLRYFWTPQVITTHVKNPLELYLYKKN